MPDPVRGGRGGRGGGGGGGGREDKPIEVAAGLILRKVGEIAGNTLGTLVTTSAPLLLARVKGIAGERDFGQMLSYLSDGLQIVFGGDDAQRYAIEGAFQGLIAAVGDGSGVPTDKAKMETWFEQQLKVAFKDLSGKFVKKEATQYAFLKAMDQLEPDVSNATWGVIAVLRNESPEMAAQINKGMQVVQLTAADLRAIARCPLKDVRRDTLRLLLTPPAPPPSVEDKFVKTANKVKEMVGRVINSPEGQRFKATVERETDSLRQERTLLEGARDRQKKEKSRLQRFFDFIFG